ncbi:hypothetical protein [Rhizobium sp. BT-175]|uniref:hypothetical protein n=1 Tax=Rhizobium sp. BT-175 TaxID=2986929 RepID=UPI0022367100|nr:hypothetical protein [Rhizobium sp. BT-175]MCV9947449.1 hypothetical protein [Rhizobium sp. BT-175]
MGEKRKKIYEALVDGATDGHSGNTLYDFVQKRCPKTSGKKIVRASLLALTDPHVTNRNVLDVIYALAIKHRMDEVRPGEDHDDDDDVKTPAPSIVKAKRKRATTLEKGDTRVKT